MALNEVVSAANSNTDVSSAGSEVSSRSSHWSWPWPVIGYWMFLVIFVVFSFAILNNWRPYNRYFDAVVFSSLLGQMALATMIAGLAARHWLVSWLVASLLACFHTFLVACVAETGFWRQLTVCSLWPLLLLSTSAPLVVLRNTWGWTLSMVSSPIIPRWRSSLEDLLLLGVVVASCMTIAQTFVYSEGQQSLSQLLRVMVIFSTVSLICVPVTVYVTFRSLTWKRRLSGWACLTAFTCLVQVIAGAVLGDWNQTLIHWLELLLGLLTACLITAGGLMAMVFSGYQLTYFASHGTETVRSQSHVALNHAGDAVEGSSDQRDRGLPEWLADKEDVAPSRADATALVAWHGRIAAAALVVVAVVGGVAIYWHKRQLQNFYERVHAHAAEAVHVNEQKITGLELGAGFVASDLDQFRQYRSSIRLLSLAGAPIDDAFLSRLKDFPALTRLDLSNTRISDQGLDALELPRLETLSLADTAITWPAVRRLLRRIPIAHLDLSGLEIGDQQLSEPIPVSSLAVRRTRITDAGLARLLENQPLTYLDVSDTAFTGSTLSAQHCPPCLILDGTQVSDAVLIPLLAAGAIEKLSVMRTGVTAAIIPVCNDIGLRLGRGPITDKDLITTSPLQLDFLGLNDPQFTGQCLTSNMLFVSHVDLSHSSVNQDVFQARINRNGWYETLCLANTQVTDEQLLSAHASQIDLRQTKITSDAVMYRPKHQAIIISHQQFSPAEMARLHRENLYIDHNPQGSYFQP